MLCVSVENDVMERIVGGDVLLGDLENRSGDQPVPAQRLVLDAGLRAEGGGVAEIGGKAIVEEIANAGPAGEGTAPLRSVGVAGDVVNVRLDPVVAAGKGEYPVVDPDLVLRIEADLGLEDNLQAIGRGVCRPPLKALLASRREMLALPR